MVQLSAYMVAIAAMMMGIQALDQSSASAIESSLVKANVLPSASSSASIASPSGLSEEDFIQAEGLLDNINALVGAIPSSIFNGIPAVLSSIVSEVLAVPSGVPSNLPGLDLGVGIEIPGVKAPRNFKRHNNKKDREEFYPQERFSGSKGGCKHCRQGGNHRHQEDRGQIIYEPDFFDPGFTNPPVQPKRLPQVDYIVDNFDADYTNDYIVPDDCPHRQARYRRAIYDVEDETSSSSEVSVPDSFSAAADNHHHVASSSVSAPHAAASGVHSSSVKAVLRARGGLRAAQVASQSSSHHAAAAAPSHSVKANGIDNTEIIADLIRSNIKASLSDNFVAVSSVEADSPLTAAAGYPAAPGKNVYFSDLFDPAVVSALQKEFLSQLLRDIQNNSKEIGQLTSVIGKKLASEAATSVKSTAPAKSISR